MSDSTSVPLGFWLRTVDSLFESSMDELFAAENVTRRLWQVLSSVKRNEPATTANIDEAMALFLGGTASSSIAALTDLADRGWIEECSEGWVLSLDGQHAFADMESKVKRHRVLMFRGVDDADYRTTVETLALVKENLEAGGGRGATFR